MRIGIAGIQTTELVAKSNKDTLSDAGFESFYFKNNSKVTLADLIIVLGGDRGVRNYLHSAIDVDTPVLGISESESNGVLAQIELIENMFQSNFITIRFAILIPFFFRPDIK